MVDINKMVYLYLESIPDGLSLFRTSLSNALGRVRSTAVAPPVSSGTVTSSQSSAPSTPTNVTSQSGIPSGSQQASQVNKQQGGLSSTLKSSAQAGALAAQSAATNTPITSMEKSTPAPKLGKPTSSTDLQNIGKEVNSFNNPTTFAQSDAAAKAHIDKLNKNFASGIGKPTPVTPEQQKEVEDLHNNSQPVVRQGDVAGGVNNSQNQPDPTGSQLSVRQNFDTGMLGFSKNNQESPAQQAQNKIFDAKAAQTNRTNQYNDLPAASDKLLKLSSTHEGCMF